MGMYNSPQRRLQTVWPFYASVLCECESNASKVMWMVRAGDKLVQYKVVASTILVPLDSAVSKQPLCGLKRCN